MALGRKSEAVNRSSIPLDHLISTLSPLNSLTKNGISATDYLQDIISDLSQLVRNIMTTRLSDIKGTYNAEYNDTEVRLLIRNSEKVAGEPAQGDLAEVLRSLGLPDDCYYWDIKRETWRLLGLENPVRLPRNEIRNIRQRTIRHSAEITILRDTEGRRLAARLNLPPDPEKDYLERTLVDRIRELGERQIE